MNGSSRTADFYNRVAIVTGAGQGIGRVTAEQLAKHGAKVLINDIVEASAETTARAITASGGVAIAVCADVSKPVDVEMLVSRALTDFSSVHMLVNSAGVLRASRLPMISEGEWDIVLDSNLKGTFLCSQAVLPHFILQQWGRIVNLSSTAGKSVSTLGGAHYTAAKAGVLGLTRAFAKELGKNNIRVNAVCPGLVNTEMVKSNVPAGRLEAFVNNFPIARICEPAEVADLILFLLSERSNYITGASFDINGGDLMI